MKLKCQYGVMPCPKLSKLSDTVARCLWTQTHLQYYDGEFYRDDYCPIEQEAMYNMDKGC